MRWILPLNSGARSHSGRETRSQVHKILTTFSNSLQMFLTVYLSNNDQHFTEVPVTPETACRDVVELCKEPGEVDCHLAEVWRGSGKRNVYTHAHTHIQTNNQCTRRQLENVFKTL